MSNLVMGCTALVGINKAGALKPDENGYYTVVLGALDFRNSVGEVYTEKSAREIFKESSGFMRRLRSGYCRGEYGHPKPNGMTNDEFLIRIMTIEETRVSHHISEVWIDTESVKHKGQKVIAIMGKILPSGPYGEVLAAQLLNPKENVAFSVRSITDNYYVNGRTEKDFREIACWDYVTEPGLAPANKYAAPGLESLQEFALTVAEVEQAAAKASSRFGYSLESSNAIAELAKNARASSPRLTVNAPRSASW